MLELMALARSLTMLLAGHVVAARHRGLEFQRCNMDDNSD